MAKESAQFKADRLEGALVEVYGIANEADGSRQAMTAALDELQEVIIGAVPNVHDQWQEQSTDAPDGDDEDEDADEDDEDGDG